jgi:hypothetical protein
MTERHQIAIFEAMESPDFYPHTVTTIEQRDTHISKVFLNCKKDTPGNNNGISGSH